MTATAPRPVGRPPIGDRVEIRLPADLLVRLDTFAEVNDWTRAEAIRQIIATSDLLDFEPQP